MWLSWVLQESWGLDIWQSVEFLLSKESLSWRLGNGDKERTGIGSAFRIIMRKWRNPEGGQPTRSYGGLCVFWSSSKCLPELNAVIWWWEDEDWLREKVHRETRGGLWTGALPGALMARSLASDTAWCHPLMWGLEFLKLGWPLFQQGVIAQVGGWDTAMRRRGKIDSIGWGIKIMEGVCRQATYLVV